MSGSARINSYVDFVIRWRWAFLVASLLLAFGLATGMPKLGLNNDYRVFFSEDNPDLTAFDALENDIFLVFKITCLRFMLCKSL